MAAILLSLDYTLYEESGKFQLLVIPVSKAMLVIAGDDTACFWTERSHCKPADKC